MGEEVDVTLLGGGGSSDPILGKWELHTMKSRADAGASWITGVST